MSSAAGLRLSVAIPTFGREEILVRTARSILDLASPDVGELLIVDQTPGHEPETAAWLRQQEAAGALRLICLDRPSLTRARNEALKAAACDVVLFLDDDILVPPHLFREHLRLFAQPDIAAVTGQVYNCLDWQHPPPLSNPEQGTRLHSDVGEECDARNTSGGNHSVRRSVALAIGGFDERFIASALSEDLDFSQRLLLAGHRIRYNPKAWIIHLGYPRGGCGITGGSAWPEWTHSANLLLYAFRHGRRQRNFLHIFWMALRNGPLRKEVAARPIRWPAAWWGFLRGLNYGWRHRRFEPSVGDPS